MQLEHQFTVPVPVAQAWDVLLDVDRVAPCLPGATIESYEAHTVTGRVKLKVGPIQVTYTGTATVTEKDLAARRIVMDVAAKEARGTGTATATVNAVLTGRGQSTDVALTTDLQITGKPAQFGRGVILEVGNKLLGRFADCLAEQLGVSPALTATSATSAPDVPAAAGAPAAPAASEAATGEQSAAAAKDVAAATSSPEPQAVSTPSPLRRVPAGDEDAIDVLDAAGGAVLKRLLTVVGGAVLVVVLWRLLVRPRG
jgi:carbon monoxide dehydrogenase subunit G